ncbi:MAG TPA: alpha/beta hydrolase [Candidatus Eisenbacteria bacterium]|nr:alpha/beta hydrolase [Candidatus Eisenbacteria bacterium]
MHLGSGDKPGSCEMTARPTLDQPLLWLAPVLLLLASPAFAQPGALQDSTLDNLVHATNYVTAAPGTLGAVLERGKGPIDMVLVSGFGVGASAFEGFMRRNQGRYRMFAVTLPGFEGSPAPPMPAPGTSYGDQTWTRAAIEAVVKLIRERKLARPVLVGHFINGTQVTMRIAIDHPELVRAVVLLAGTPRFEPVKPSRFWPKDLTLERKVQAVDQFSAPRWFKTVTRATWVKGNFVATDYSADSALGARFADRANEPPLPVLVRYLCEFHASDLWPELDRVRSPLLVIQPSFTTAVRSDTTRSYLQGYFEEPWRGRLEGRPRTETTFLENAGILVMEDQPVKVDRAIADFLKRMGK